MVGPSLFEVLVRVFGHVVEDLGEFVDILLGDALAYSPGLLEHPVVQFLPEAVVQHLVMHRISVLPRLLLLKSVDLDSLQSRAKLLIDHEQSSRLNVFYD